MGKTFDQSLIDTAIISMSMIDPEDMEDTSSEEFQSLRRIQDGCHSELSNREDFPFNKFTKTIQTSKGLQNYSLPEGRIVKVRIYNNNSVSELNYDNNIDMYNDISGTPYKFTITYNPNKIKLYPIPNKIYKISIDYINSKNVILPDGNYSYKVENNSELRMPEQYQHLYFDALEYYVLSTYMRKASNPRWEPTYAIFEQRWRIFLRGCQAVESETIFSI